MKSIKNLIPGVIITVAMIVLLSSGVAGYGDEKNETGEELPDLTISNVYAEQFQGYINFGIVNFESGIFRCLLCNFLPKISIENERGGFIVDGDAIEVHGKVSNIRGKTADNISIGFYVDGKHLEYADFYLSNGSNYILLTKRENIFIPHISKDEIYRFSLKFPYMTMGKSHNITIKIDPNNHVKESNEDNNELNVIAAPSNLSGWSIWGVDLIIIIIIIIIVIILVIIIILKNKINKK
jgi:hypothetical protein